MLSTRYAGDGVLSTTRPEQKGKPDSPREAKHEGQPCTRNESVTHGAAVFRIGVMSTLDKEQRNDVFGLRDSALAQTKPRLQASGQR